MKAPGRAARTTRCCRTRLGSADCDSRLNGSHESRTGGVREQRLHRAISTSQALYRTSRDSLRGRLGQAAGGGLARLPYVLGQVGDFLRLTSLRTLLQRSGMETPKQQFNPRASGTLLHLWRDRTDVRAVRLDGAAGPSGSRSKSRHEGAWAVRCAREAQAGIGGVREDADEVDADRPTGASAAAVHGLAGRR